MIVVIDSTFKDVVGAVIAVIDRTIKDLVGVIVVIDRTIKDLARWCHYGNRPHH